MITLKSDNLSKYLEQLPNKVLLIFASPTCPLCKEMVPEIEKQLGDKISILYINGDKWENIADKYDIEFYPTIIYLIDGIEKKRIDRVNSKNINKILK